MISIHGTGITHQYAVDAFQKSLTFRDTDYGYFSSSLDFNFSLDTSWASQHAGGFHYSLKQDTLRFSYKWFDTVSILIAFAPGTDSILSLNCYQHDSTGDIENVRTWNFNISSLAFNDTSIFMSDSSMSQHHIEASYQEVHVTYVYASPDYFETRYSDFTASSVKLSGIFLPTTLSNEPAMVQAPPQPQNLVIAPSCGSVSCSFNKSDQDRSLEVYSLIGIRINSLLIPAKESTVLLPPLPAGSYFIKLGNSLAKIAVAK